MCLARTHPLSAYNLYLSETMWIFIWLRMEFVRLVVYVEQVHYVSCMHAVIHYTIIYSATVEHTELPSFSVWEFCFVQSIRVFSFWVKVYCFEWCIHILRSPRELSEKLKILSIIRQLSGFLLTKSIGFL